MIKEKILLFSFYKIRGLMISNQRIVFLDYLRVFAFLSVLIGHKLFTEVSNLINMYPSNHISQQYLINFVSSAFYGGGAGVIVFFMISGYIILHVINYENPIEFLIKRFFRIYPLLIFAIIIQAILLYTVNDQKINFTNLFLQMSLFGDFFNTPYSLAGVEWTLRVEIIFYIFVAVLSFLKLINKGYIITLIFVACTILLEKLAPFPSGLFVGYFTIYFPFLFLGSVVYFFEKKKVNFITLFLFIIFIFENYFSMIGEFQKGWLTSNFAVVGFIIFILLWLLRNNIINFKINKYMFFISSLTYSVYLFHNFLWSYIGLFFKIENKFLIFLILLIFCFIVTKIIENPMNKLGKTFSNKFKNYIVK